MTLYTACHLLGNGVSYEIDRAVFYWGGLVCREKVRPRLAWAMQAVGRKQDGYLLLQYLHSPRPCGLRGSFAREQDLRDFYRLSLRGVYPGKVAHESFLKAGIFAKSSKASHSCARLNFSARGFQQYRLLRKFNDQAQRGAVQASEVAPVRIQPA